MTTPSSLTTPSLDLTGRTALVTGASSGLGARFAELLVARGAKVICAARRVDRLQALVGHLQAKGGQAVAVAMDVAEEASIVAGFDAGAAELGSPDIVIANAGLNEVGLCTDISAADFDSIMNVNVRGAFLTAREGARRMMANPDPNKPTGRVVLIASMGGIRPMSGLVPYCVSKAAVVMMAKGMAVEWARKGVNVNAICPGYIETEINADWLGSPGGQKMIAGFPRRRVMADSALDGAFNWLVSDASEYVSGSVVQIDDTQGI